MSKNSIQEKIDHICENFKNVDHSEQAKLLEEITAENENYIRRENNNNDSTGGAFGFLSDLAESVQEDFKELIGVDKVYTDTVKDLCVIVKHKR